MAFRKAFARSQRDAVFACRLRALRILYTPLEVNQLLGNLVRIERTYWQGDANLECWSTLNSTCGMCGCIATDYLIADHVDPYSALATSNSSIVQVLAFY